MKERLTKIKEGWKNADTATFSAILEVLFLLTMGAYVFWLLMKKTTFQVMFGRKYSETCVWILTLLLIARVLLTDLWRENKKNLLLCLLVGGVFLASYYCTAYPNMQVIGLGIMGAYCMDYRKLLKLNFWLGTAVVSMAFFACLFDNIEDYVFAGKSYLDHSLGMTYNTDAAALVLYLLLMCWVAYQKLPHYVLMVVGTLLAGFLYFYCGALNSTVVIGFFVLCAFYLILEERFAEKNKFFAGLKKVADWCMLLVFPVGCLAMNLLTIGYGTGLPIFQVINKLTHKRLMYGYENLKTYGVHAFGTYFVMNGNGGSTGDPMIYNFIDSSYVQLLICYGWIPMLVITVLYVCFVYRAIKCGNRRLAFALAVIAVHCIEEHHLVDVQYNIFLLLPFADITPEREKERTCPILVGSRSLTKVRIIAGAVCAAVFAALFVPFVSLGRTLVQMEYLYGSDETDRLMIAILLGLAAVFAVLFLLLTRVVAELVDKEKGKLWKRILLCVMAVGTVLAGVKTYKIVSNGRLVWGPLIQQDLDVLGGVLDSGVTVYSDAYPTLYHMADSRIKLHVMSEDGLSPHENTLIIADKTEEYWGLLNHGFTYTEINDNHAVYTNSATAVALLEEAGYELCDYYTTEQKVDMVNLWTLNPTTDLDENTLRLFLVDDGDKIYKGPYVSVTKGVLRVDYDLQLLNPEDFSKEKVFAVLEAAAYYGQSPLNSSTVTVGEVDENGRVTVTFYAKLSKNADNIEFKVQPKDGVKLVVESIRYRKVNPESVSEELLGPGEFDASVYEAG